MFAAGPRGTAGTGTGPNMAPAPSLTEHFVGVLNVLSNGRLEGRVREALAQGRYRDDNFGDDIAMIGVAADHEGYIWTVAMYENAAYKFDPVAQTYETIPIGELPYTYSDMTGVQLSNVTVD